MQCLPRYMAADLDWVHPEPHDTERAAYYPRAKLTVQLHRGIYLSWQVPKCGYTQDCDGSSLAVASVEGMPDRT